MLVKRKTFRVKGGHTAKAVTSLKAAMQQFNSYTHAFHIHTPETGPFDIVAVEWEYESLVEYGRLWAEWGATPDAASMEGWDNLTQGGGASELWWLAE